jgi:hypothetical protein
MMRQRAAVASALVVGALFGAGCAGPRGAAPQGFVVDPDLLRPSGSSSVAAPAPTLPSVSLVSLVPADAVLSIDMMALARSEMAFALMPRIDTVYGVRLGLGERTAAPCLGARCGANVPLAPRLRWVDVLLGGAGPMADAMTYDPPAPLDALIEQSARAWPDGDPALPPRSTLVRVDGGPRVAIASRDGEMVLVPRAAAADVAQALTSARLAPAVPPEQGRLATLRVVGAPRWLPVRPPGLKESLLELRDEPQGGLWLRARLRFDEEGQVLLATGLLRRALDDALEEPVPRFLLGEWLRSASVESHGKEVRLDANGPKENVLRVVDLLLLSRGM